MEALKQLIELDYKAKVDKYPSAPSHAIAKTRFSDKTANGLTKAILRWLQLHNHTAWRQGSEGRYRPGKQVTDVIGRVRQMKGMYLPGHNKGASDVAAIINGRFCAIEVKMKDKQSEAQKAYQKAIESSGGLYTIVRTFNQFMQWYNQLT